MKRDEAVRKVAEVIRRKHLARSTEQSYCGWLRLNCDWIKTIPSHWPSEQKLEQFLTTLAQEDVAASTQNQALNGCDYN